MPLNIDTYPHPQLRYTVRLEYLHPAYNEVLFVYIFMSDEEFEKSYYDIIGQRKDEIREEVCSNEDWEYEITEWGEVYTKNVFGDNNAILSENVISLIKTGEIVFPAHKDEDERELALAYLNEIRPLYTKEQLAKAILDVIDKKPNVEMVNRVLKVWGITLNRDTYVEMKLKMIVNSNEIDLALGKMLKINDADNLRRLKSKLEILSSEWNLEQEEDAHKCAILLYRFFMDCTLIERNKARSIKSVLEAFSVFLSLPITTYTKEVQLTSPVQSKKNSGVALSAMEARKQRIYSQINPKWATFKSRYLK